MASGRAKAPSGAVGVWRAVHDAPKSRELRRLTNGENAWRAVSGLSRGGSILGLTKGEFSLIDMISALLDLAGPSEVVVSTWTAARKEISDSERLLKDGRIVSLRWLVDFSFPRRQPEYCELLRSAFGDESVRVSKNHAKFVIVRGGGWHLVVRTSMNLNKNPRLEYFEVEDSAELADFFAWVVDEVFSNQEPGALLRRPSENEREFKGLGVEFQGQQGAALGADLTDRMKPGFGRFDGWKTTETHET